MICASSFAATAAPKYIVIHKHGLHVTLEYVDRPDDLKKWYYDRDNNTYYRAKNKIGINNPIVVKDHRTTTASRTK